MNAYPPNIGRYEIKGVLGKGAMGVVYVAFDPAIRRMVALKSINRKSENGAESADMAVARFKNEAQAAGRLVHPGIVAVYEYGEEPDLAYIAMEYVEGTTLRARLDSTVAISEHEAVDMLFQILGALDHAHLHGVFHRDIKPSNLIIGVDGKIKIADFGVARISDVELTQVTSVIGTPSYMAPEQCMGTDIDARADIYSAGVVFYEMLTGVKPFVGSAESVLYKIVHQAPVAPSTLRVGLSLGAYDEVVLKALAKDRDARYPTAFAFKTAVLHASGTTHQHADSDATVLVTGAPNRMSDEPRAENGPGPGDKTGVKPRTTANSMDAIDSSSITRAIDAKWDGVLIAHLQRELAIYVGPLASVLVRRAAVAHDTLEALVASLGEQITSDADRNRFRSSSAANPEYSVISTGVRRLPRAASATGATATGQHLDPGAVEHAIRVLVKLVGPIAGVLVRREASHATTLDAFFIQVAAQAGPGTDHAAVLAELRNFDLARK